MKQFRYALVLTTLLFASCATSSYTNRRHSEFRNVIPYSGSVQKVEVPQNLSFSVPLSAKRKIDFMLPGGTYELRFQDAAGYYFRGTGGSLKVTYYGKQRGGIFVPRDKGSPWRVWVHPNYGAAIAVFGAAGAGLAGPPTEILVIDPIPDTAMESVRQLFLRITDSLQSSDAPLESGK